MNPDNRSIGELAYRLWQARGCPDGTAEEDWLEAERQLSGDKQPVAVPAKETLSVKPTRSRAVRSKAGASNSSADRPI